MAQDPCQREEDTHIAEDPTPFLCVATGTQCHGSQRVDITYRVLMQAWFAEAAQLAHPSDRMQALDNVPPALRRANPNLTRDYYLRMRAQPAFLLKTAPVCQEAVQALAPTSLQDLMRTVCGPTSPLAASATTPAYPTPPHHTPQPSSLPSRTSLAHHGAPRTPCSSNLPTASTQPEVLYAPGASIPAALQPKAWALASGGARLPLMLLPAGHTGSGTASPSWASQRPLPPQQAAAEAGGGEAGNRHEGGATRKAQSARPRHTLLTPASPPPRPSSSRVSTHLLPLTSQQPQPSTSPAQAHADAPGTGRLAGNSPAAPGPGSSSPPLRDAPTPSSRTGGAASSLSPSSLAPAVLPSKQLWTLSATSSAEPLPARQPGLTSSDLQALRQLTDACAQAEVVTQSLLAQAGQLLLEHDAEPPVPQPLKPAETLRGPGLGSNTAVARSAAPPAPHTSHLSGLAGRPARGGTAQLSATLPGEGRPPLVGAAQRTGSGSEGVVGAIRGAGRARSASQPPPDIRLPDINKSQCVSTQSVRQDIFGQRADAGSRGQVLAGGMLQLKKDGLVATGPVPNLHASLWSANEAALLSEALNESALE
ncbi:hypothetical protein QJQ45_011533 [Haematococcus lacustris]|nr:hypothetical protein QJQ45_011533 [Haematococcus lacustris]